MRWDIISAALTFTSMLAVGQRKWQGWGLAFLNSVAVCILAAHVAPKQWALIPTNVFCLVIYTRNLIKWRRDDQQRRAARPTHRKSDQRAWIRLWPRIHQQRPSMKLAALDSIPLCASSYLLKNTTERYLGDALVVLVGERTHAE
jgi:hypothetical protein